MILDDIANKGAIAYYSLEKLDEEGNVFTGKSKSGMRETERVTLTFNNGDKLLIDTFCSGSQENTSLHFEWK